MSPHGNIFDEWPTGTVATHYDPDTHRVDYVEDASTNRTSYAYDEDTGRLASVTNALGNKSYYLYNARGQVTHTWGDVPQPVVYGYDDYGQRTTLTTFRIDNVDWTADEWPTNQPEGDTTTWTYDEATGVVTAKRYADDKGPDYDYTADGRLSQRTWARQVGWPPEPLTTDYSYHPATGELTGIDYSDSTPDVSFTFTRTGAPATVIDVVGTRTFAYNDVLQLLSESMGGASPMHTKVITRTYENGSGGTLAGRYNGVQVGPSADPSADYSSTYYYDSRGRLSSLNGPATPMNRLNYVYLANSDLVHKIEYVGPVLDTGPIFVASVIRSFEPNRDLMTSVENKWNDTTVSKFEYTNDALGRRTSVTVSGTAFTAAGTTGFDLYTYNDRNELASAKRYSGGTLENPTNPVYSRHFNYDYDPIGNRESYQIGQGTATTYSANELNQYTATADPSESFTHDDDGNLTQDGTYTYVWDAENRLIEAYPTNPSVGSNKCVMDYDYMNRRVRRTLYVWNGSSWTAVFNGARIFVYDGWNTLVQYNPQSGAAMGKYTWGLDLSGLNGSAAPSPLDPNRDRQGAAIPGMHAAGGIGGLLCAWRGGTSTREYFCFYDANGNLSDCVKNSDGTLWTHVEYDPYGDPIVASDAGGLAHPFQHATHYFDGLFAKHYQGQRYLCYGHARWLSRQRSVDEFETNEYTFTFDERASVEPNDRRCTATWRWHTVPGFIFGHIGLTWRLGDTRERKLDYGWTGSLFGGLDPCKKSNCKGPEDHPLHHLVPILAREKHYVDSCWCNCFTKYFREPDWQRTRYGNKHHYCALGWGTCPSDERPCSNSNGGIHAAWRLCKFVCADKREFPRPWFGNDITAPGWGNNALPFYGTPVDNPIERCVSE